MGGTIGFFVICGISFILSIQFPYLGKMLMNPFVLMITALSGAFLGKKIEENGKITIHDVKESIQDGVKATFYWFFIWIAIALVFVAVVYFFKVLNFMPTNY